MPTVPKLASDLAVRFGLDDRTVSGLARALREAGYLTAGAHGVNAPPATSLDGARLLLAVLLDCKTVGVVREFDRVHGLELNKHGDTFDGRADEAVALLLDALASGGASAGSVEVLSAPLRVTARAMFENGGHHEMVFDNLDKPDFSIAKYEQFDGIQKTLKVSGDRLNDFADVIAGIRPAGKIDTDEEWAAAHFAARSEHAAS